MTWMLLLVIGCGCEAGFPSFSSSLVSSTAASWTSGPGEVAQFSKPLLTHSYWYFRLFSLIVSIFLEAWPWCLRLWRVMDTLLRSTGGTTSSASSFAFLTTWNFQSSRLRLRAMEACIQWNSFKQKWLSIAFCFLLQLSLITAVYSHMYSLLNQSYSLYICMIDPLRIRSMSKWGVIVVSKILFYFYFYRKLNGWPLHVTTRCTPSVTFSHSSTSRSARCCWSMFLPNCSGVSDKVELSVTHPSTLIAVSHASHGMRHTLHCSLVDNVDHCASVLHLLTRVIQGKVRESFLPSWCFKKKTCTWPKYETTELVVLVIYHV